MYLRPLIFQPIEGLYMPPLDIDLS
ncbi:conserved protein of unknown function [Ectopseudomonas oleovorans]|uniref:Uncharacterized protein n=1 Tax=Ectopseudomonas oleovorans TaxID=301 RepID=A0A653BC17_ECTOL|nr:conserved protein of unknown function [Pseudomonas oleovorans]